MTHTVYNALGQPVEVEDAERAAVLASRFGWSDSAPEVEGDSRESSPETPAAPSKGAKQTDQK